MPCPGSAEPPLPCCPAALLAHIDDQMIKILGARDGVPPNALSGEFRLVLVAEYHTADLRMNSVGPDDDVIVGNGAVGEFHVDLVVRFLEPRDSNTETHAGPGPDGRFRKNPVECGSAQSQIGRIVGPCKSLALESGEEIDPRVIVPDVLVGKPSRDAFIRDVERH